ncbi:MAG: bifunctional diaminohydroxyphosphoribosylaminopyrimidine deaminase/5-amino-6-(5-phosphoribosylamino)uracil reductase RibD [Aeromicrobium sp.]|uniref:bifunctional diaminohydroxyphosphoribosylaminopyrimidine deaminase/5-amino-6-(5-phosphoribosylamino)uracil reductase RibD n=1 Tax=Aeromicrobium sp. TaxID=1871063 RepID=UPI003C617A8E
MASDIEIDAMRRALEIARERGSVLPNPTVGCVLLTPEGREISRGATIRHGAHAEVDALRLAGDAARGGTAVVTLEPCNHTGRTGPCSQALIRAGIRRVVFAQADPHVTAAGGADTLRAAGISVEAGILADEVAGMNAAWTFAVTEGRPFVTWKYAATLDGRSAAPDGTSQWITGVEARRDVHRFRAASDAIMVGTGTVLADDPRLTIRDEHDQPVPREEQPLRVVVGDSPIPTAARVLDEAAPSIVISSHDPAAVLAQLAEREVRHVWLEGGPRLAGAFWDAGLIDRVIGYIAPAMLGAGHPAVSGGASTLSDLRPLDITDLTVVGSDIRFIGAPGHSAREDDS